MIDRQLTHELTRAIEESPAVVLLGPRQVGKTTLAMQVGEKWNALYLDLESQRDLAKLKEPEIYLDSHVGQLIIIDEVHRLPGLFPSLRGIIDRARRQGVKNKQFLLLGSASLDLLAHSGESLAGRVFYLELGPFNILEIPPEGIENLWVRGGFPDSFLAQDAPQSLRWRENFIRTYLERDIPQFGPRIAAQTLRRFWEMLAHYQGCLVNHAQFANNLGVDTRTAIKYLDLLVDLLLVRRIQPWYVNIGKRLVKTPKVYIRDSGIAHALLKIVDKDALLSHPVIGHSWECFVIENLLAVAPMDVQAYFYRTSAGAEIDLLLHWPDQTQWAIEIKHSLSPKLERGFHQACEDLKPVKKFLVYPGKERYRTSQDVTVISLQELAQELAAIK